MQRLRKHLTRPHAKATPSTCGRILSVGLALLCAIPLAACATEARGGPEERGEKVVLPAVRTTGGLSLVEAIAMRRSVRTFADRRLTDNKVAQLLWATQGVTDPRGFRAAPSAGALYPLEIYLATEEGLYHYEPGAHSLTRLREDDLREALWRVGLRQDSLRQAAAVVVMTAVIERTAVRYGERAERYIYLEVGHAAQNLLLQAVALDLAAVPIGAFDDQGVQTALSLPEDHAPIYLIPIGHPAE
jgi:SagB-type dehydrogenase family enzyme